MIETSAPSDWAAAVAQLAAAVDALLSAEVSAVDSGELLGLLQDVESQRRRLAAVDHTLVGEVESRGLAHEHGCTSTTALLRQALRLGAGEAAGRVRAARDLGPRRAVSGEPLAPLFTRVAAAERAGQISPAHARIITDCVTALPDDVQAEHDEAVETFLTEQAAAFAPEQLATLARRVTDTLDPDGLLADERYRNQRRSLDIHRRRDGSSHGTFDLTAALTETLLTVLDATSRPDPSSDGTPDPRSATQRRHDGLLDALTLLLRADELPHTNGVSATVLLTITEDQLRERAAGPSGGSVTTGHGARISLEAALMLATDARVIPIVFGKAKRVSAYGSGHRIFTEGQRLAMIARDQGCSFPGCDAPPHWCEAHHAPDFAITGRTTIAEGTLVCGRHHREHAAMGYRCDMIDGVPHWVPPAWIDPAQRPLRNWVHDPQPVTGPVRSDPTHPDPTHPDSTHPDDPNSAMHGHRTPALV
jgi:Domain of unknown function (DUF222)